ncbi:hypothetical protein CTEN210_00966 [Chaetoceros tenuissimus]|uniref:Uncharacterized protein n=1 Tax=Chaetoceros tenuissimus TaxID=426638 RepID=A0AAD3GYW5_9STRA|nr:hypothetical protein CTEN210_00966 [Chaetoceros tenuissimus]
MSIASFGLLWYIASSSNIHEGATIEKEDKGISTTSQRTDTTRPNLLFIISNDVSDPLNLTQKLVTSGMYYRPKENKDTFVDKDVEKQSQIILHDQSFEMKHNSKFDNALAIERIRQWKIDFEHLKEFLHKLYVFETVDKEEEHNRYHTYVAADPQLSVTLLTWLHFLKVQPAIVWITSHPLENAASKLPDESITNEELHRWILHHRYSIYNMKDRKLCTVRSSYDNIDNLQNEQQRVVKELETKCNIMPSVSVGDVDTMKSNNITKLKKVRNECSLEDFGFSAYLSRGIIKKSIDKDLFITTMKLYCKNREKLPNKIDRSKN